MDFNDRSATLDGRRLVLTRKEYELLFLLVQNAGEVMPHEALLTRVWGLREGTRTRTLDVHISKLRKKLGSYRWQYIETIFGTGYRFHPFRTALPYQPGLPASALGRTA
jgi:two-component system alkaline phosphatase synthesis response regulator PhoP